MAPASDAPARKGFSLTRPNTKTYLIVGGAALAAALAYFWWKKRQAASAAADTSDTGTGTSAPGTPTGLNTADWMAWLQDHSSSSTTTTTGGGGGTTSAKTPDYWDDAIAILKTGGNPNPTHAQIEAQYRKIAPAAVRKKEEAANKAKGKA